VVSCSAFFGIHENILFAYKYYKTKILINAYPVKLRMGKAEKEREYSFKKKFLE